MYAYSSANPFPLDSLVVAIGGTSTCTEFESSLQNSWRGEEIHGAEWYSASKLPDVIQRLEASGMWFHIERESICPPGRVDRIIALEESLIRRLFPGLREA